ncbi:MAG: hypothetical protein F7B19_07135 [Desulfurococcales archaeon]|nr:hypothetical protein [Desulfurococcales archaeon]
MWDKEVAKKIIVELELPDDARLEDLLKGVKYKVIKDSLRDKIRKVREKHVDKLGGPSDLDEYKILEEELWRDE